MRPARTRTPRPAGIEGNAIRLDDGSLVAVLECPLLPPPGGTTPAQAAAWIKLLEAIEHPIQLTVRRRAVPSELASGNLRDSYESLLGSLWSERKVRTSRLYAAISWRGRERDSAQAFELSARDLCRRLREVGIETARVPAGRLERLLAEAAFEERPREVAASGCLARTLTLLDCPTHLPASWLATLGSLGCDLDASLHLQPVSSRGGLVTAWLQVTVWSDSVNGLDEAVRAMRGTLDRWPVQAACPVFEQGPALLSALPLGILPTIRPGRFTTRTLAGLLSVWAGESGKGRGLLLGVEPGSRRPVLLDRLTLGHRAALVLGGDQAGRSRLLRMILARARISGASVAAVDAAGDTGPLARRLGGRVIKVTPGSPTPFTPFQVRPVPGTLASRMSCLAAAIDLALGGLDGGRDEALAAAISLAFALRGFTDDGATEVLKPPGIAEVIAALDTETVLAAGASRLDLAGLRGALSRYASGPEAWLFQNSEPTRELPGAIAFDLTAIAEPGARATATLLALEHLREGGRVVVSEVPGAGGSAVAAHLAHLTTTPSGLWLGAPHAEGTLAKAVAGDCLKVLLRQTPETIATLAGVLHLTPAEQSWLLAARPGEGLLVTAERRAAFELALSQEEQKLIDRGGNP